MPLAASRSAIYASQRKRWRWKRRLARLWLLSKFLLGIGLAGGLAWGGSVTATLVLEAEYFRLRNVEITGLQTVTEEEAFTLLALPAEISMWRLNLTRLGTQLSQHPYIHSVTLRRQFPNVLLITVRERTPALVVTVEGKPLLIDDEGVVLRAYAPEADPHFPSLKLSKQPLPSPGTRLRQPEVERAFALLKIYQDSPLADSLRVASFVVQPSGGSVWRFVSYDFDISFGEEEILPQLERLPLVLRYIAQQHLTVRAVDLSYRKRIVITPVS